MPRPLNIKLNDIKFRLRQQSVLYFGHLLTERGFQMDPENVRAISELPRPIDVKGVQRIVPVQIFDDL